MFIFQCSPGTLCLAFMLKWKHLSLTYLFWVILLESSFCDFSWLSHDVSTFCYGSISFRELDFPVFTLHADSVGRSQFEISMLDLFSCSYVNSCGFSKVIWTMMVNILSILITPWSSLDYWVCMELRSNFMHQTSRQTSLKISPYG